MPTAVIDGIATRYEVEGSGPPLLMFSPGGFNAVLLKSVALGRSLYSGLGAGAMPTGSAVIADVIDICRNLLLTRAALAQQPDTDHHGRLWHLRHSQQHRHRHYRRWRGAVGRAARRYLRRLVA